MTPTTTGPDANLPRRRPYVFPSMQAATEIDPASVEVPIRAIDVHGRAVPGLFRPPLRPAFVRTLELALVANASVLNWPWGAPPARYYSPNAIVALLAAEDVDGWVARTAERLQVPPDELTGPLLARQRSWHTERQLDQLLVAEQRDHDRLHGDPYWAALRHLPASPRQEYFRHLLDATGTTAERARVAEVLTAHDGYAFRWSWHLSPITRERYRRFVQDLNVESLRARVAAAARLLRTRPPDPSVTLANAWTVRELLHDEARRGRARIERYQSDLDVLPARRLRVRRDLRLEIAAEHVGLRRIVDRLKEVREVQEHLDQLRTRRRLWEAQPAQVEVLAVGELSAERLRLLEFGALCTWRQRHRRTYSPPSAGRSPPRSQSRAGRGSRPLGRSSGFARTAASATRTSPSGSSQRKPMPGICMTWSTRP
jgi:hypothetical protein